ncbi:MAG: GyrI-like domain-containing protein [Planctomycetota bacterium]
MDKLDLKKADRAYYGAKAGSWQRLRLPACRYLAVLGQGAPESPAYAAALHALYPTAYAIKFASKAAGRDFTVPPQSTQWWSEDLAAFTAGRRDLWQWRAMLRMPDWVDSAMLKEAMAKKGTQGVELMEIDEGDVFQTLHIGPYADEGPTLAELHDRVMPEAGVTFGLPHHEIYLSDPRRTAPEKLKTILRQPVVAG